MIFDDDMVRMIRVYVYVSLDEDMHHISSIILKMADFGLALDLTVGMEHLHQEVF